MSLAVPATVGSAIQSGKFSAVYYLVGDDDYRKETCVRTLTDAAVDPTVRDFNVDVLRGADTTPEQLGSILGTPPMMSSRRVVVVRGVDLLKKDLRTTLDEYLTRPAPDVLLLLVNSAGAKPEKGIESKAEMLTFAPLTSRQMPEWIVQHVRSVHHTTITKEAMVLLEQSGVSDTGHLVSELDKLASYCGGQRSIGADDVSAIVGIRHGETVGDFLDAVAARDSDRALGLVAHVLQQPKANAVTLVMALTVQTLAIAWGRRARERGVSAQQMEGKFFDLLKQTGAFPMRPWPEATKSWAKSLGRWTAHDVDRALDALLAADRGAKDSRVSSDEQLIGNLVFALCVSPTAARA